jgi:hypothetical protein
MPMATLRRPTTKRAKRYRYYVSASLLGDNRPHAQKGMRVPAGDVEGLVLEAEGVLLVQD